MTRRQGEDPRTVTVLGATGSVGRSTLDLIGREPDRFRVVALTCGHDVAALAELCRRHRPDFAAIADASAGPALAQALTGTGVETGAGPSALIEAAERDADLVMAAIVGVAGLGPTLAAVRRGAVIALANKECLVSAGALFLREVAAAGATLLPVDSEHSAIFQTLQSVPRERIRTLTLTASGGPFRTWPSERIARATREEALCHPTWSMGAKITIDSATMMNKGLELIEAAHLFSVGLDRLAVLVHPESIVHGLVSYVDGSVLAQLGPTDMRVPIAVALAWPDRMPTPIAPLDLARIGSLTFAAPDPDRFPAITLAREVLEAGGAAATAMNAANEVAVQAFLDGAIGFGDIVDTARRVVDATATGAAPESLEEVVAVDAAARSIAARHLPQRAVRAM